MENEKDEAKQEAKVARLTAVAAGDSQARVNDDLTRARDALAAAEEDRHKLELRLPVWRLSERCFY